MRTIIHLSDIHFGKTHHSLRSELMAAFKSIHPDLVIISGDLTQRALAKEFAAARLLLGELKEAGMPCFVIPGNHDIAPLFRPISRLLDPYRHYKRYVSKDIEPAYSDDEIAVVSINTVRPSNIKNGSINIRQIKQAEERLSAFPSHLTKIIVTHHPFDLPLSAKAKKLISLKHKVVEQFARQNVALYLSGHYHVSSSVPTSERYKIQDYSAIAVQAGTLSRRERGEARSFNVITIDGPRVSIATHLWNSKTLAFEPKAPAVYHLAQNEWQRAAGD